MAIVPITQQGYKLLHEGMIELARVEQAGMRVDKTYLKEAIKRCAQEQREIKRELQDSKIWKRWRQKYGVKSNFNSRAQLAAVFREELEKTGRTTDTGKVKVDKESLATIDDPFIRKYEQLAKLEKAGGTYLKGIQREVVGDRIHPSFNLHTARTYRSSSDTPNFQNFPVRDKEIALLIRTCFIASPGCVIVENDYKGVEVSVSACYHQDQNFISYITTPGKDMHRDMAAQIYMLDPSQVDKDARYGAKNKFVFPQFYGDFFMPCARNLWEWIDQGKLKGPDGKSLKRWLKSKGITGLGTCDPEYDPQPGTFEYHLMEVEDDFWNNRFGAYNQWKKDWYEAYLKRGYFDLLTGFRIAGSYKKNHVTNYPVQGSAFHCLLWSLIRVNRLLRKYKMKSRIVGQIHDSIVGDVRTDELKDYLEIVQKVTSDDILKEWSWISVPLTIEYEISPPGYSWYNKKEIHFDKGVFFNLDRTKKTTNAEAFLKYLKKVA